MPQFRDEKRNVEDAQTLVKVSFRRPKVDREHVKGAADKAKGSIKETAGKISGDTELQSKRDVTTPS